MNAELYGASFAIELAFEKGWHNLCFECDSLLVILAFKSTNIVRWHLRNRWNNCIELTSRMRFRSSHIFHESNNCADKIASLGFVISDLHWWNIVPLSISEDFFRNRIGLPNYRFK